MKNISVYLSFLLRHHPDALDLKMDHHGWVSVSELIEAINQKSNYSLDLPLLEEIVRTDNKGRFRFGESKSKIKACQGHSIPWVEPELTMEKVPQYLYHGTTESAYIKIMRSGEINKMKRHAVHMQEDIEKAWQSAKRWHHQIPVVLKINAEQMSADGISIGVTENNVWCADAVPIKYITEKLIDQYLHYKKA